MKGYGRYEVLGRRAYRGHEPGSVFEAALDPAVEFRAVQRGSIRLLERVTPSIAAEFITRGLRSSEGWPDPPQSTAAPATPEAAQAASLIPGGR